MVRKIAVAASLGNVKLRQVLNYENKPYVNFDTGLSIGGKIQIAKDLNFFTIHQTMVIFIIKT